MLYRVDARLTVEVEGETEEDAFNAFRQGMACTQFGWREEALVAKTIGERTIPIPELEARSLSSEGKGTEPKSKVEVRNQKRKTLTGKRKRREDTRAVPAGRSGRGSRK